MTTPESPLEPGSRSLMERRIAKIANARSATFGLAGTFLVLALIGGVLVRLFDEQSFPSFGLAVWWALQTVTTVGYGDVVPEGALGKTVGAIVMVVGVSFIAFLTAGVTSAVVRRSSERALQDDRERAEHNTRAVIDALGETRKAIADLERRLDHIETNLRG